MVNEQREFDLLMIGFDQTLFDLVNPALGDLLIKRVTNTSEMDSIFENCQLAAGSYAFVSTNLDGMSHLEVAQSLATSFVGIQIVFITLEQSKFDLTVLKKNGFTECFLLPMDKRPLDECIDDVKSRGGKGRVRRYKAVKLIDIEAGMDLPFEVITYLPLNDKYVLLTGSGALSQKKVDLLHKQNVNSVFVDKEQLDKFYEFTADRLLQMGAASNDSVSQTEKSETFRSAVRDLYQSVLDATQGVNNFARGRDLMEQSKKVVEGYVEKKTGLDLKAKLTEVLGEGGDSYSHAQAVSTVAALLSMGTGIGQPEDLAIAGLFHDIGIIGVDELISPFDMKNLSEEGRKAYIQHPRISLNLLREKRITVPPQVAEIIEKHHERMDGQGFPGGLPAHRIPETAHLLAYADAMDFLSQPKPGKPRLSPHEIHNTIVEHLNLNPDVTRKIAKFLDL